MKGPKVLFSSESFALPASRMDSPGGGHASCSISFSSRFPRLMAHRMPLMEAIEIL